MHMWLGAGASSHSQRPAEPAIPLAPPPAAALTGLEQSLLANRLGPAAVFNPKRPTGHWVLDAATPGGMEVGRRLVAAAVAAGDLPNIWNLRLQGGLPCWDD
jgi:hypothetical protein